ncbi:MAG: glycosyltransferase family 4 protein [Burkholderiales bacterium]|nr:glycosyltransferase family 4 protein [Burkholderiales bacterium]
MRILLAHNYYGSSAPSGENQVFDAEKTLLRERGHDVAEFTRHSDKIRAKGLVGAVQGALATPWNPWMVRAARRIVDSFQPDIVHVHNTFPLISPAIFYAIGSSAARVLTLHNYRLFCPAAIPMRAGQVCTECLDSRSVLPAVRHGCYRGSRLATLPLAAKVALHRHLNTWSKQVDAFVALTEFQRERMIVAGLPADLVHVKPNFYPGDPAIVPWAARRPSVIFAGRLTAEKGVLALVRAWLMWGASAPELRIVGDGGLRRELERLAAMAPEVPIRFLGQLAGAAARDEIARARLLVLPSECFEGFPMVVREAFAFGTPVAVSNIGPLPSIVQQGENGVVFAPDDPQSLLAAVRAAWGSTGKLECLAAGARRSFEALYTEEANYRMLMAIYEQAKEVGSSRKK